MKIDMNKKSNKGFTLLEVLIAVLVLSIGLLGLAGLQLTGLRNNHSAQLRGQATQFAYDMVDQMRANPVGMGASAYNSPTATATASCLTSIPATGCTPAQMAEQDMFEWAANIAAALPDGDAIVCLDATPEDGTSAAKACSGGGSVYALKLWWTDDRSGAEQRFVTTVAF